MSLSNLPTGAHILLVVMLKKIALISLPLVFLTGCSVEEIAQSAADAAACRALEGSITGVQDAYEQGLVDSGVIAQIDELIGDQLDALLSTSLADDLRALGDELSNTSSAQSAGESVESLTASISQRCSEVGVEIGAAN